MSKIIELQALQFSYPEAKDKNVLDINQWSVDENEHVFLHGPSGSGKSTLLNIIGGVLDAYQGDVRVLGQSLQKLTSHKRDRFRAEHIGYVFQQFNLIPYLNATENLLLASQFCKKTVNAKQHASSLLDSLNINGSEQAKPVSKLSVGQQQRIAIARAMMNKPELLIADEPTSSLDEKNSSRFMDLLMQLANDNGTCLLFVSHDMNLAQHFKRVESLSEINSAGNTDKCS